MTNIDDAFRGAAASIEHLVRTIVRDELRQHLGPEGDQLINVKNGPMSVNKLRRLVRSGELQGFKQGRDTFISASALRAFIEKRPVPNPKAVVVPEPPVSSEQDGLDDVMIELGLVPTDPAEHRAFDLRQAQRRAEGGPRGAALAKAEKGRDELEESQRRREERQRRRDTKKAAASALAGSGPTTPPRTAVIAAPPRRESCCPRSRP